MYLAMDELGSDLYVMMQNLTNKEKWHKIIELLEYYRLDGIQFTPSFMRINYNYHLINCLMK